MKRISSGYGKLIIGLESTALSSRDKKRLIHPSVGGVILFTRNFESAEQLNQLTEEIKSLRTPSLPIMVDQEGGRVQRFNHSGFTTLPSLYETAQQRNDEIIKAHATILAYELIQCGVDLSLTPSLDLYNPKSKVINTRAFSSSSKEVSTLSNIYINTLQKVGMGAVIKHFPGHGSITNDTHVELAENHATYNDLLKSDLYPFKTILSSNKHVSAVMASHVLYKNIDSQIPTFSEFWLKEVLRDKLAFNGLIFSDDMGMFAANANFKSAHAAVAEYFSCSGDMTLLCNDFNVIDEILDCNKNFILDEKKQVQVNNLCVNKENSLNNADLKESYYKSLKLLEEQNLI